MRNEHNMFCYYFFYTVQSMGSSKIRHWYLKQYNQWQ